MIYTIFFGILFISFFLSVYIYLAHPIYEIKVVWFNLLIPIFLGFIFSFISSGFFVLVMQCLVIQIIAPRFVVFMINRSKLVNLVTRTYQPKTKITLLPILGIVLITIIFLTPNQIDAITGQFIFNSSYFANKVPSLISVFLAVIIEKERGAFSVDGFFVKGILFKWSNFHSFSWESTSDDFAKLVLKLRDKRQITAKIALADKEVIGSLLSKTVEVSTT